MVRVTKLELHRTISEIMKKGDLDDLTTKKIRLLCEQRYNIDLSSRKEEIDRIVMAFVNKQCENRDTKKSNKSDSEEEVSESESEESESSSESSESSESESSSESERSEPEFKKPSTPEPKKPVNKVVKSPPKPAPVPVPKKVAVKRSNSDVKKTTAQPNVKSSSANSQSPKKPKKDDDKAVFDDAEYARKLQASEFSFRRKTANNLFRDTPGKKTATDDPAKKKKPSAFQRKCLLSPALAEVLGTDEMSRPDIVQKMWSIVRERNLFDQSNKQYAKLDEQLRNVFGTKRVRLMGMMKYLKKHIKDIR